MLICIWNKLIYLKSSNEHKMQTSIGIFPQIKERESLTPKQLREISIGEIILDTAEKVKKECVKLKKRARFYTPKPVSKKDREIAIYKISMILRSSLIQLNVALSKPLPKFEPGGIKSNAIVRTTGPEVVISPSNKKIVLVRKTIS